MATYADISRLDSILKDRPIMDAIQKAINTATPLAEKISQKLTLSGRKGIFPVSFGVNEGHGARADRGTLPASQVDSPSLAEVYAKFLYSRFDISGPVMSATRDSPGAFQEAMSLQLEKTVDGVKLDMGRQILNASANGVIALVNAKVDTTSSRVDSPFGLTTYKTDGTVKNILRKGMPIDIIDTDGSTVNVDNSLITAVAHTAGSYTTLTYGTAETNAPADGDFVVRQGSHGYEMQGFFDACKTTGTYMGISRSGLTGWQGVITDGAGGGGSAVDLTPDMMRDEVDAIMEESGQSPDYIVANYKQRRNIYNLWAPQIRYAPMVLHSGLDENTLKFDDIPVIAERFFPPEHIGFVNTKHWYHAIDKDSEWIQGQNGTVLHFTLTADVFEAVLRSYRNLVCLYPATQGYLYGVDESY